VKELFLLDPGVVFLNHGSFGACPRPVFAEYQRLQLELEGHPAGTLGPERFPALIAGLRARIASYVGADPGDIALVPNATIGVNMILRSLTLERGDEVVTTSHAYGGNIPLLNYVCERAGARCVVVDTWPGDAADDILGAVTSRTRALLVDHISSATALRFPVAEICSRAREAGVITIVDGAHAPGQIALDVTAVDADFYVGNFHKWLCSPKGAGFLHARPDVQALLEPVAVSWDWGQENWADRQRWSGTRDPSAHLAVPSAIDFQAEHAWDDVRARCHDLAVRAERELIALGAEPLAANGDEFGQMVAVRLPPCDAEALGRRLFDEHRVEVLAQEWNGWPVLRVSFQGYNDESDLEALVAALPSALPDVRIP
jgi:isopenicillin-N epimerase